jgi:hypothetical protein
MLAHPAVLSLSHNFSREDLFLVVYCLVDDYLHARFGSSNAPRKRRGPRDDEFADSEVLTIVLVGELCQVKRERAWLRQVRASHSNLFPRLPEDSRFARRGEAVRELLKTVCVIGLRANFGILARSDMTKMPPLCAKSRVRAS